MWCDDRKKNDSTHTPNPNTHTHPPALGFFFSFCVKTKSWETKKIQKLLVVVSTARRTEGTGMGALPSTFVRSP